MGKLSSHREGEIASTGKRGGEMVRGTSYKREQKTEKVMKSYSS